MEEDKKFLIDLELLKNDIKHLDKNLDENSKNINEVKNDVKRIGEDFSDFKLNVITKITEIQTRITIFVSIIAGVVSLGLTFLGNLIWS